MVKVLLFRFQQPVLARLPCHLPKAPLKWDFFDIYLITFSGVHKFKKKSPMRVIFFVEMFKTESKFQKSKKKIQKMFFLYEIISSQDVAINCLY